MHPTKVGPRDLILLAGLPGAGKSTLLAGLRGAPGITVRDSDQMRALLGSRLPSWLPYRFYRPLVHAAGHQLRMLTAALQAPGPLVRRHVARAEVLRCALFSGVVPPGWRCAVLLDRAATRDGLQVAVQGPRSLRASSGRD